MIGNFAYVLNQVLMFVREKWYLILLAIGIIFIIKLLLDKRKLKQKKHDELKLHHEKLGKIDKYNPTYYQWLYSGTNKIGKIKSKREKNFQAYKKTRDKDNKPIIRKDGEPDVYVFLTIAPTNLLFFWFGKDHLVIPREILKYDTAEKKIIISQEVDIDIYKGYQIPSNYKHDLSRKVTDYEFSKSAMDHEVNAHATQMVKLSSVEPDKAHDIRVLEKQADLEKAKRQRERVG